MTKIKKIAPIIKFTPQQLHDLIHEDGIWENTSQDENGIWVDDWYENQGKKLYEIVDMEDDYVDLEKSYKDIIYTIKEIDTGKYYQDKLSYSMHWSDEGANQKWKEVQKVTKTIVVTKYE